MFTELQDVLIVLQGVLTVLTGVFETRVEEYRVEMEEMPASHNPKSVGKKMINFFVESGTLLPKTTLTLAWATVLFLSLCQHFGASSH